MSAYTVRLIFRDRYIACLPCFVLSIMAATDIHTYSRFRYNKSFQHVGLYQVRLPEPGYIAQLYRASVLYNKSRGYMSAFVSSGSSSGTDISLAYRASSCQQWLQLTYIYVPCCRYNKSRAHVGLYHQAHLPEPIYRSLTVLRLVSNGCN
ncbi:hypothetical protein J6590_018413 [Homalodisca vitripennis]|nr:hypothetical protein J6590_018413 [Homalodisca vitripennis]